MLGATWQRCRVDFMWTARAHVPPGQREMVAAASRTTFAQETAEAVHATDVRDGNGTSSVLSKLKSLRRRLATIGADAAYRGSKPDAVIRIRCLVTPRSCARVQLRSASLNML